MKRTTFLLTLLSPLILLFRKKNTQVVSPKYRLGRIITQEQAMTDYLIFGQAIMDKDGNYRDVTSTSYY